MYNFETAKIMHIMHKASTNSLPSPLNLYFKKVDNVHNCATRSSFHKNYFLADLKQKKLNAQLSFKVYPFEIKSILKQENCITKNFVMNAKQLYRKNVAEKEI